MSTHKRKIISFTSLKNVDLDQLNKDLARAPWNVVEIYDSVDDQCDMWKSVFETVIDKHMPTKKMRVREKNIPYMTEDWKKAVKNKRKYARLFARSRTPENWELKRKWRNLATKER